MDVFQVLTLCLLLSVMFLGVLSYGLYRNWQRNQLDMVRVPPVGDDLDDATDFQRRIYPSVVSFGTSKSPSTSETSRVAVTTSGNKRPHAENEVLSDSNPVRQTLAQNEVDKTADELPKQDEAKDSSATRALKPKDESSTRKTGLDLKPIANSVETNSSSQEDDGLNQFRRSGLAETSESKKSVARKSTRSVKNETKLDRKPPQRSKRWKTKRGGSSNDSMHRSESSTRNMGDEFVILFVVGEHDTSFRMSDVSRFLLSRELVLDELGLFCRKNRETGEVLFKVADVFYPGSFNTEDFETYRTAGVSLVMKLPNVSNALVVFEQMMALANDCAERFAGTVRDENYNKMSNQTIAHYRHRVSDFRRKQLTMYA